VVRSSAASDVYKRQAKPKAKGSVVPKIKDVPERAIAECVTLIISGKE
jgi:hypothetical protein